MKSAQSINDLNKEELIQLLQIYAKNWLAHDGCWFLSIEEKHGMQEAIDIDKESWRKFTIVEAKRLIDFLELGENSGIDGLAKSLKFRLYSTINDDKIEIQDDNTLLYYVKTCRVQSARRNKGLNDFPCDSVGIVEYSLFAQTIDSRFQTKCRSCLPNINNDDYYCIWQFSLV